VIWVVDLLLLTGVSGLFASKHLFLGIVIFTLGLFVFFQVRRSRLLVGFQKKTATAARRSRAILGSVLISAAAAPLLMDSPAKTEFFEQSRKLDALFPVVILVGLLGAALMIGLSVEERKR
jgi:hypothetical protein